MNAAKHVLLYKRSSIIFVHATPLETCSQGYIFLTLRLAQLVSFQLNRGDDCLAELCVYVNNVKLSPRPTPEVTRCSRQLHFSMQCCRLSRTHNRMQAYGL